MKSFSCIAYYLGQFHPTPENNEFWGEGFTEWHTVARARPLYPYHSQPALPGRLGFYDLRHDNTLRDQIDLAVDSGIDAFCHWHYWFAGRRALHLPLDRMVALNHKRFRFILGWANESWTGIWHGASDRMLIEQSYNEREVCAHGELIASYIRTGYYLRVNETFPLVIYKPNNIPDPNTYLRRLRDAVYEFCGERLYLIGNWTAGRRGIIKEPSAIGLDAVVITPVAAYFPNQLAQDLYSGIWQTLRRFGVGPEIRSYRDTIRTMMVAPDSIAGVSHATVVTGWDNTPRSGRRGLVLRGYNKERFAEAITKAISHEMRNPSPLLFIKSWNEWAEGNVLEPQFRERWSALQTLRTSLGKHRT